LIDKILGTEASRPERSRPSAISSGWLGRCDCAAVPIEAGVVMADDLDLYRSIDIDGEQFGTEVTRAEGAPVSFEVGAENPPRASQSSKVTIALPYQLHVGIQRSLPYHL
jgi:hypothetical protein